MKKFYALAMAAAMAGTAFAATPLTEMKAVNFSDAKLVSSLKIKQPVKDMEMAPASRAVTEASVCQWYYTTYHWGLDAEDQFNGGFFGHIVAGKNANEVLLKRFPFSDIDIVATLDAAKGTITIEKQDLFYNTNYQEMVVLQPERYNAGSDKVDTIDALVGTIDSEGNIVFPDNDIMAFRISAGYFYAFDSMRLKVQPSFTAADLASGWTLKGEGAFTDNFLNLSFKDEYRVLDPQPVKVYVNDDNTCIAIQNPYAGAAWSQINYALAMPDLGLSADGFLYIDVTDPECVLLRPAVESGFWMDMREKETDEPYITNLDCYNEEGQRYFVEGVPTEDIAMEMGAVGVPTSYLENNTIEIYNLRFGVQDMPFMGYYFKDGETSYTIELPEDWAGVEGIASDMAEGPAKYYNLQGVEVAAPVKGQLVIKTQGGKSTKFIAR